MSIVYENFDMFSVVVFLSLLIEVQIKREKTPFLKDEIFFPGLNILKSHRFGRSLLQK